ncbi:MAG: hypothetical protein ACRDD8_16565 [Bacteroidales bacterium]
MNSIIKTVETENYKFEVIYDDCTDAPMHEYINIYLSERSKYASSEESVSSDSITDIIARDGSVKPMYKRSADYIYYPLYAYIHGNISLSTSPFNCRFDSGLIGYVAVSKINVRKFYNVTRITPKVKLDIASQIEYFLEYTSNYKNGENYILTVYDKAGEEVDVISITGYENIDREIESYT